MQLHKQYFLNSILLFMLTLGLYVLVQLIITAVSHVPHEGDSVYYHIPLAHSILDGTFIYAEYGTKIHMYFPAASEFILAVLLALNIPLGYFNILALILLFVGCVRLGIVFLGHQTHALTFAATVITLQGIVRWGLDQTVDIWLAVYYVWILALVSKPWSGWGYYFGLGSLIGLLIGSKYSGPLYGAGIAIVYGKFLLQKLCHDRTFVIEIAVLIICTIALGGFWYIRNWFVTGNPFFPLDTPLFPGEVGNSIISFQIWKAYLHFPKQMFDGAISEFGAWPALFIVVACYLLYKYELYRAIILEKKNIQLLILAAINFFVFLLLPSGDSMQLHISQYRFSYVVIIPLIVLIFRISQKIPFIFHITYIAVVSNLLVISFFSYKPKLMIAVILTVAICYKLILISKKLQFRWLRSTVRT